jgi:hypothetical protein
LRCARWLPEPRMCHAVCMKTRNQRELEKHWAKEAAKKAKSGKQNPRRSAAPKQAAEPAKENAKE